MARMRRLLLGTMAPLFVGGVMNILWIALLALFISLEKVTSLGRQIAPVAGIILIAAGVWLLFGISEA
jgi:predicted metal-binding membrane protein